ncbi:hypothetical protein ACFYYY_00640 [Streptomyces sp. NPDC001834]|uniref:hypothetical protein n=1 Tax=Streptomyces sp. NPDC001834 TaxID=3364616 RepID=UPI00368343A1
MYTLLTKCVMFARHFLPVSWKRDNSFWLPSHENSTTAALALLTGRQVWRHRSVRLTAGEGGGAVADEPETHPCALIVELSLPISTRFSSAPPHWVPRLRFWAAIHPPDLSAQ